MLVGLGYPMKAAGWSMPQSVGGLTRAILRVVQTLTRACGTWPSLAISYLKGSQFGWTSFVDFALVVWRPADSVSSHGRRRSMADRAVC